MPIKAGIKIGQFETNCPADSGVIKRANYNNTGVHASRVFIIMDTVAPNVTYYATGSGDDSKEDFKGGIEWLLGQGVNVINMSYGFRDAYNNSVSYYYQRTYKPDISAPGCYEITMDWGTSYSAPLVTGTYTIKITQTDLHTTSAATHFGVAWQ